MILSEPFDFKNIEHLNYALNIINILVVVCAVFLMFWRFRKMEQVVASVRTLLLHRTLLFQDLTSALRDSPVVDQVTQDRFRDIYKRFNEEWDEKERRS